MLSPAKIFGTIFIKSYFVAALADFRGCPGCGRMPRRKAGALLIQGNAESFFSHFSFAAFHFREGREEVFQDLSPANQAGNAVLQENFGQRSEPP